MIILSFDNLVEVFPQRGTFVSKIRLQDVREDHFIWEALETVTIRYAVRFMTQEDAKNFRQNLNMQQICVDSNNVEKLYLLDQELHKLLPQAGHSQKVWNVIDSAKLQLDRVRKLTYPMSGYAEYCWSASEDRQTTLFLGWMEILGRNETPSEWISSTGWSFD